MELYFNYFPEDLIKIVIKKLDINGINNFNILLNVSNKVWKELFIIIFVKIYIKSLSIINYKDTHVTYITYLGELWADLLINHEGVDKLIEQFMDIVYNGIGYDKFTKGVKRLGTYMSFEHVRAIFNLDFIK